ncbi:hypothetical protein ACFSRY_08040 [Pontibacter locisalis]|uniref:Uncharacterized protein n=1 Tax=Pontibacter locisalis TaxID=1719035 RepID=A0ABW5IPA1_9BACT
MAKVHYLLSLLLALTIAPLLFAQEPTQPVRLELPFNTQETRTEVIALPDSSLLLYYKNSNVWNTKADFNFTRYNHRLEEVWKSSATVEPDKEYVRHFTEAPFTYIIFSGEKSEEFTFLKLNLKNGSSETTTHTLEDVDAIYEFNVLYGKYFLIGRNRENLRPLLLYLNPAEKEAKILPAVYGAESTFSDMLADPSSGRVDVVMTESNGRVSRLQVKSFNSLGKLISNNFILQQDDKSLLNAEITPGDTTQKILLGTYGSRDLRYTRGFFSSPLASSYSNGRFYNLLQLQNFLKYMKSRREERTRNRESARVNSGKETTFRYRVLLHDLIATPEGYVLAGEIYYPQYRSNNSFWSTPRSSFQNRTHEGFKRTHAVALGFDKQGILIWDNTFPLKDVSTPELYHALEVGYSPDGRVIMAYPDKEKIIYHVMHEDEFEDEENDLEILLYNKNDKVQFTEYPGLINWYGANFVAFGFQRIKPSGAEAKTIFYINKISF